MVGGKVIPAQPTLNGEVRRHFPAILDEQPLLPRYPGRIVAEADFIILVVVAEESIRQGGSCSGRVQRGRSEERKASVRVAGHLVVIIFAILFNPEPSLDHVLAVN